MRRRMLRECAVLMGLMLLALAGGSALAASPGGDDVVDVDDWFIPLGLPDVVATLRALEWSWTEFDGDTEMESMRVLYQLVGPADVAGQETTEIHLTVDGELWRIWLDPDGDVVQAEIEGELMPQMFADMVVGPMLTGLFWPFSMVEAYGVEQVIVHGDPGWDVRSVETTTVTIGDLEVPVTYLEVMTSGAPYLDAGQRMELLWGIADFGAFQMLVEWRVTDLNVDEVSTFRILVERVIPR